MSRVPTPRFVAPDAEATRVYRYRPSGRVRGPGDGRGRLLAGAGSAVAMLLLGLIAKTGPVAALDLRVDRHIATHDRTALLTAVAKGITDTATPETIGVGLMLFVPIVLLVAGRRLDALQVFCMFAGAFTLAELGKKLVDEHRPPAVLWAMKADSGASYPSGHTTTAAVVAIALVVIAATAAGRAAALLLGALYTVAVAASRVYLADHYPLDVVGSVLCAVAAASIVTGLVALPAVRSRLHWVEGRGGRHRASGPGP